MALPQLTNEQRKAASAKGVAARQARAAMCEKVKHGEVDFVDVLTSDDPVIVKMRTYDLIKAIPGYGVAKANRLMEEIGISKSRRIQGLGQRQRDALLAWYLYDKIWEQVDNKEVPVKDILYSDDPIIQQMLVVDLISACHGYGKIRANKVMRAIGIWPPARINELDDKVKDILVDVLDNGVPYM